MAKTEHRDHLCHTQLAGICYLVAQPTRPIKRGRSLDLRPVIKCIQQCPPPVIVIMLGMVSGAIDENDDMGVLWLDITSVYRRFDQQPKRFPVSMNVGEYNSCVYI